MKTLVLVLVLLGSAVRAWAEPNLATPWPSASEISGVAGQRVEFRSYSPFTIADMPPAENGTPTTTASGRLFLPDGGSRIAPAPAVILLHGASGVRQARELTYARQLASRGVAALVIDVFRSRRHMATGFINRLMNITEAMFLADAYSGLAYLRSRPEVDPDRVVLIGFSYGGMAATYAAFEQVAERFASPGARFAGHVAFYAPCIVEFEDERATGAPLLMLYGGRDALIDPERCRETAGSLERGGSEVRTIVYEEAAHQWDGGFRRLRPIGRNLAECHFVVEPSGLVRDARLFIRMTNTLTRQVLLGLCADRKGYLIGSNDAVRSRSNRDLAAFLEQAFGGRPGR